MSIVYDAGVLVAADRGERRVWADHQARLEAGILPATTSPVVAQVSRSAGQAQLRRFLRGCHMVGFATDDAHRVGSLLAEAGTSDVVDAHVVTVAVSLHAAIVTSDPSDLRRLAEAAPTPVRVLPI